MSEFGLACFAVPPPQPHQIKKGVGKLAVFPLSEKLRLSGRPTPAVQRLTVFLRWILAPLTLLLLLLLWTVVAESGRYPAFMLPHPADVLSRLNTLYERGLLQKHIAITLREAL